MKPSHQEPYAPPIVIHMALLEQSAQGARTARLPGRTCRVTYAPPGKAQLLTQWIPTIDDGGIVITWPRASESHGDVEIRAVYDVREALATMESAVAVITNEGQLLAPPVYQALASVLKGLTPEPSPHHYDALGTELGAVARILLSALDVPGFVAA